MVKLILFHTIHFTVPKSGVYSVGLGVCLSTSNDLDENWGYPQDFGNLHIDIADMQHEITAAIQK
jgi:hypothetical protein